MDIRNIYVFITVIYFLSLFSISIAQNCPKLLAKTAGCSKLNLCYAIDESSSINRNQFLEQTKALISLTKQFSKQSPDSIYSAIGFSGLTSTISLPTSEVKQFESSLINNKQSGGATNLGAALSACAKILESSASPRVIVLITDGKDGGQGISTAPKLKKEGFIISTIGVGPGAPNTTLPKIASHPSLYTDVASFSTFTSNVGEIVKDLCDADDYEPPCQAISACFAIDETSSITSEQFKVQSNAVIKIASEVSCKAPSSKFSAAGFSGTASTISIPTSSIAKFSSAILSNTQNQGSASLGSGLLQCSQIMETYLPKGGAPRLIVLFTDGVDDLIPYGDAQAPILKNKGYIIATVGVGPLTSELAIKSISSDPSLHTSIDSFKNLLGMTSTISESFCNLPAPAPPTPSPTASVTPRPLSVSTIPSLTSIPEFNPSADEAVNLEILRKNIEYYVSVEIGRGVKLRVDSEIVSAAALTFPWNIIERERGERFYWVIKKTQQFLNVVRSFTGSIFVSSKQAQAGKLQCRTSQCAAHVKIWSEKFVQSILIERAMNKFYAANNIKPAFQDIFSRGQKSFFIIKRNSNTNARYSVFLKYKESYVKKHLEA